MTTKNEYETENKSLMDEFKQAYKTDPSTNIKSFVEDGIVNPDKWFSDNQKYKGKKILFLLKETHSDESWPFVEWLSKLAEFKNIDHRILHLWKRVVQWTYGLINTDTQKIAPFCYEEFEHNLSEYINNIAVVNVKKTGGGASANMDVIQVHAKNKNYKDLLKRQIKLIDPDIIVCGYTFGALNEILGGVSKDWNANRFYYSKAFGDRERLILDYYHPANRYPDILNYYSLAAIYQQALLSKCKS